MDLIPKCLRCDAQMSYSETFDDYYCPECGLQISKDDQWFGNGEVSYEELKGIS